MCFRGKFVRRDLNLQYSRSRKFDLTRVRFAIEQSFDSSLAPSKGEVEVQKKSR